MTLAWLEPAALGLESSTLPLSHCSPICNSKINMEKNKFVIASLFIRRRYNVYFKSKNCRASDLAHAGIQKGEWGSEPPPPPEKSQKCRVSKQYWCGSPENISQHSKLGHHRPASETSFKWRFAHGPNMARF